MKTSKIIGLDQVQKKLQKIYDLKVEKAIEKACDFLADEIKRATPVDSGDLKKSISFKIKNNAKKGIQGVVFTNLEYATYVEFGTGPTGQQNHVGISPNVNPRYNPTGWSYYDPVLKKWIHTKGQKAQPFMYPIFKKNEKRIVEYIALEMQKQIRRVKND